MHRLPTRFVALLSVAALAAVSACSSDSPTAPKSSVTTQQAFDMFATVAADTTHPDQAMLASFGELVSALGAPVVDVPVTIAGQSETFHVMALALRADSSGVPQDSAIVAVGWRGDNAAEIFFGGIYSDSGKAGYPLNDLTLFRNGDVYYDSTGVTMSATATSGSCTPAAVSSDPSLSSVQTGVYACTGAKISGGYSGTMSSETSGAQTAVKLSLSNVAGASVKLHTDAMVLDRAPAPSGRFDRLPPALTRIGF